MHEGVLTTYQTGPKRKYIDVNETFQQIWSESWASYSRTRTSEDFQPKKERLTKYMFVNTIEMPNI